MSGTQWRKIDIELEESDWELLAAETSFPSEGKLSDKFHIMRKKADSYLIIWMVKEGMLTQEQAVGQLKELNA